MTEPETKIVISFVIPAYNEEKSLPGCLKSILDEIKKEQISAEVLVVNNASTDATGQVARSFSNVIVVDEPKKGITFARQAGYMASRGRLVANIDADNHVPAGWLKKAVAAFDQDPGLICLSGPLVYYDLSRLKRAVVWFYSRVVFLVHTFNHYVFRIGAVVQGGNFVATRQALNAIGGFDTRIKFYGEDTDLARRFSSLGKVKFSLKFFMYSSGRRLAKEGVVMTGLRYVVNYYSVLLRHKPATEQYKDIRS